MSIWLVGNTTELDGVSKEDKALILEEVGHERVMKRERRRDCGDCSVCCVWPTRPPGSEPASISARERVPCDKLGVHLLTVGEDNAPISTTGCTIYEDRPQMCRDYSCAWRIGMFSDENMRPDISGMLIEVRENDALGHVFKFTDLWHMAADSRQNERALCIVSQIGIVLTGDEIGVNTGIAGPQGLLQKAIVELVQQEDISDEILDGLMGMIVQQDIDCR